MERDSLILYAKTEALLFQVYPAFNNYPKRETNGVCIILKSCFAELLKYISRAKEVPSLRKQYLQKAAGSIANLVTWFRLSRERHYISKGFYEQIDLKITEIKRIMAGFLRSASRPRQAP